MTIKRWVGNAPAIFDIWTISLSGTVASQTYSVTINSKSITYVAGGSDTVATILAGLVSAWTSLTVPPPVEFSELTPVVSGSTIVVTANTAGNPCALAVSTGGAATFSIAHTQSATGPNDFANALNWSGGVAPVNSDTLVFDNGTVACKYNLSTSLTGITVMVSQGFSGTIGLPQINNSSNTPYYEYRTTALTLSGGTAQINAPNCNQIILAFGSNTASVSVQSSGRRLSQYTPVILFTGGNSSSTLSMTMGDVGLAFYEGQTAEFNTISTSYQTSPTSDVTLYCGAGCTLGTINKNGGTLTVNGNVTTLNQDISGGKTYCLAGNVTTAVVQGGSFIWNSTGTLGTITVSGNGILDLSQDPQSKTITNPVALYGDNSSVNDPMKVVSTLYVTTYQTTKLNVTHGSGNTCSFA